MSVELSRDNDWQSNQGRDVYDCRTGGTHPIKIRVAQEVFLLLPKQSVKSECVNHHYHHMYYYC